MAIEYVATVRVKLLEERHNKLWESGVGPDAVFRKEPLGWFLVTDSGTFHFGATKPDDLAAGDIVEVRWRRKPRPGELAPVPDKPTAPIASAAAAG